MSSRTRFHFLLATREVPTYLRLAASQVKTCILHNIPLHASAVALARPTLDVAPTGKGAFTLLLGHLEHIQQQLPQRAAPPIGPTTCAPLIGEPNMVWLHNLELKR